MTNEEKCQNAYRIGIEAFYEEASYIMKENIEVHLRKIYEGRDRVRHAGAIRALEDALKNLDLIKDSFLNPTHHDKDN